MRFSVLKEVKLEHCENLFALSINYLKNNKSSQLEELVQKVNKLELDIRKCNNLESLNNIVKDLDLVSNRIEEIINE